MKKKKEEDDDDEKIGKNCNAAANKSHELTFIKAYYTDQRKHEKHKTKEQKRQTSNAKQTQTEPNINKTKQTKKTKTIKKSQTMLSMIEETGGKRCSHRAAFPLHRDTEHLWKRWRVVVEGQMPSF